MVFVLRFVVWFYPSVPVWIRSYPGLMFNFMLYGLFGVGSLAVVAMTLTLGILGKLPGTRKVVEDRGFPVSSTSIQINNKDSPSV
jgi:hypothetical protein